MRPTLLLSNLDVVSNGKKVPPPLHYSIHLWLLLNGYKLTLWVLLLTSLPWFQNELLKAVMRCIGNLLKNGFHFLNCNRNYRL